MGTIQKISYGNYEPMQCTKHEAKISKSTFCYRKVERVITKYVEAKVKVQDCYRYIEN